MPIFDSLIYCIVMITCKMLHCCRSMLCMHIPCRASELLNKYNNFYIKMSQSMKCIQACIIIDIFETIIQGIRRLLKKKIVRLTLCVNALISNYVYITLSYKYYQQLPVFWAKIQSTREDMGGMNDRTPLT